MKARFVSIEKHTTKTQVYHLVVFTDFFFLILYFFICNLKVLGLTTYEIDRFLHVMKCFTLSWFCFAYSVLSTEKIYRQIIFLQHIDDNDGIWEVCFRQGSLEEQSRVMEIHMYTHTYMCIRSVGIIEKGRRGEGIYVCVWIYIHIYVCGICIYVCAYKWLSQISLPWNSNTC